MMMKKAADFIYIQDKVTGNLCKEGSHKGSLLKNLVISNNIRSEN